MLKNLNTLLYKSLVELDFYLKNRTNHSASIEYIEIKQLVKNIKQFIRLLFFLKRTNETYLVIETSEPSTLEMVQMFLNHYPIDFNIKLSLHRSTRNKIKCLLLLDSNFSTRQHSFRNKITDNKVILIQSITSKTSLNDRDFYSIYNNTLDIKKLLFLLIVIHKILN